MPIILPEDIDLLELLPEVDISPEEMEVLADLKLNFELQTPGSESPKSKYFSIIVFNSNQQ